MIALYPSEVSHNRGAGSKWYALIVKYQIR